MELEHKNMGNQWGMGLHLIFRSILFIITTHTCLRAQSMSFCNAHERLVLLIFKQSVLDEFGMLSSWVGEDCCRWKGVACDSATRSVVALRLTGQSIWNSYYFPESNPADYEDSSDNEDYYQPIGQDYYLLGNKLNSSLAELRNLEYLDLSGNNFQKSPIPEFIGTLKRLRYLNLSNAGFGGIIPPHIRNLTKLEVLDLSSPNKDLRADDMEWVYSLSLLKHLDLSGVDLTRAQNIDIVLYMIPSLVELSLSHCNLANSNLGPYLNLSRTLPNIQYLDLSKNFFNDLLPPFLKNMTSLAFLDISNSDFSRSLNLARFLNMIPSLSDLRLSRCELCNENLSPRNQNFSIRSNIQHLDLSRNSIEGTFPSVLTNISSLRVLDLHHNLLNSSIPVMPNLLKLDISNNTLTDIEHVGIWRQCNLKQLSVSHNYLGDEMVGVSTNISECSQYGLELLHLDHNQLNGSIPESLTRLTNLRVLDLSSNKFIKLIPESLRKLTILQVLDLSSNQLSGNIPISIGQLNKLNFLSLSSNNLEGVVFESHFSNLSRLTYLDISLNRNLAINVSHNWRPPFNLTTVQLSSCKITYEFPHWLRTQINLKKLVLSNTAISGPLPTWFEQMRIIPHLDLSDNKLTGPLENLPGGGDFHGFQDEYKGSLLLQNNLFNGSIPQSLCRRTALEVLDLSKNRLTGTLPTCLENLQKLRGMILSNNDLSGVIPSFIGRYPLLLWLHLNDNHFTGELPGDMANLHQLWYLDLGNNKLKGWIPEWISKLTELLVLRLHKNNFTGRLPSSLCKSSCLQNFDVAYNKLKGPIPRCIGDMSGMIELSSNEPFWKTSCRHYLYSKGNMRMAWKGNEYIFNARYLYFYATMDLSSNELVGIIPRELTKLTALLSLNFSHNHLDGSIPDTIGNMRNLESLDFSVNKLTGKIPPSMDDLRSLGVFNLSHNQLSGPIPRGKQLSTFDDLSIYAANEDLCGPPVMKACPKEFLETAMTSENKKKNMNQKWKVWFYLDIICGFETGFWGVVGALVFKKKWRDEFYRFAKVVMDNIYVAVVVKLNKMKRRGEDI